MYFVNSTIYVEDAEGEVIGEVRQRFHLWQRNYDIYLDRRQIAVINSPLLAWEFAIKDAAGGMYPIASNPVSSKPVSVGQLRRDLKSLATCSHDRLSFAASTSDEENALTRLASVLRSRSPI